MRIFVLLISVYCFAFLNSPAAAQDTKFEIERDTDYFGSDYRGFPVPDGNIYTCVDACRGDPQCRSFTYARKGPDRPQPMCFLKNATPAKSANACCVSGRKYTAPLVINTGLPASAHDGLNYFGADYRSIVLDRPQPADCARACEGDDKCQSYSYVKPGVHGETAMCYLKNTVPAGSRNDCCVSGVKEIGLKAIGDVSLRANKARAGKAYSNFSINARDPMACRAACKSDSNCRSYSFIPPAECSLSASAPGARTFAGAVSGVKTPVTGAGSPLAGGVKSAPGKSCETSIVEDIFSRLCSIFNCSDDPNDNPPPTCKSYSRQINLGSSTASRGLTAAPIGAPAEGPLALEGYGNFGGRGKLLGDAAMCALRELSPDFTLARGGKGGSVYSGTAPDASNAVGEFSYGQTLGYLNYSPSEKRFEGYRTFSFCAPVVGCFDSVAQDIKIKLDDYPLSPELLLGGEGGGAVSLAGFRQTLADRHYGLSVETETADKEITIKMPAITIATPVGPIEAQPEFRYASHASVIETPFQGGTEHQRPAGSAPAWTGNVTLRDLYGADHGVAFPAYNWGAGFGWQSQLGLGNRDPGVSRNPWRPANGARPDYDLERARSTEEKTPTAVAVADVRFTYPKADQLREYIPSWAPVEDVTLQIWVEPEARSQFTGQFSIAAAEGRAQSRDAGTSAPFDGSDLMMAANAAGSFSFNINSGFDFVIKVPLLFETITIVDVHMKRTDPLGEGLSFHDAKSAYFASTRAPVSGGKDYAYFKTFKTNLGVDASNQAPGYVAACLADNQTVPPGDKPTPTATPGDPEDLLYGEYEVPCNICAHIKWRRELQEKYGWTSARNGLFMPQERPAGAVSWRCDREEKTGCHDICKFNPKEGSMTYVRGPTAADVFVNEITGKSYTGDTCLPDTPVIK